MTKHFLFVSALLVLMCGICRAQTTADFAYQFRVNGFGPDSAFVEPSALLLDEHAGSMYVADSKAGEINVFNLQGMPKQRYGSSDGLKAPVGLALDKTGNLLVSEDEAGPIKTVSQSGSWGTFDLPVETGAKPPKPGRMTSDSDGNLYIVDRANNRLCVLDSDRKLKFYITGPKKGFKDLTDCAVDRQSRIYAIDNSGQPVHVYDKKGKALYKFGFQGQGSQDIGAPTGVFIDRNDQVWVVDKAQNALKVFDRTGTYLCAFGTYGVGEGQLAGPTDAKMDSFGRVYVIESGSRRLQVFALSRPFEPFTTPGL